MERIMLICVSLFLLIYGIPQEPWRKKCVDHFELLFYKSPRKNYKQARSFCESLEGYLAKVDNRKMTYAINSTFKINERINSFFIGGNDKGNVDNWKWHDGTDVIMRGESGYQNWKSNQPNNYRGNENCLLVGRETYEWIDSSCDDALFYICQRDGRGRASVSKESIDQTRKCVLTTCDTFATVEWYKGSKPIPMSSGSTVYQELKSGSAILYLENAKISDSGTYSCQARINNQTKDEITMTYEVSGKPTIHQITTSLCKPNLVIQWKPNTNAVRFPHRFKASPTYGGKNQTGWTKLPAFRNLTTTIYGLNSSTQYTVEITACTTKETCYSSSFTSIRIATTGGAVPDAQSASVSQSKANQTCVISWEKIGSNSGKTKFQTVEIIQHRNLASSRFSNKETKTTFINVSSELYNSYTFQPEANRRYLISVKFFNCAGSSQPRDAIGQCVGNPKEPNSLPPPQLSDDVSGTKELIVSVPDESNGLMSCLFVMIGKSESQICKEFTLDDLLNANSSNNNEVYIAMAISASSFNGMQKRIILGNPSFTSCDIRDIGDSILQKNKKTSDDYFNCDSNPF